MGKGATFDNDWLKLIFNATAIANIADNAGTSPLTSLYVSLHTADPTASGNQTSNETSYTSYVRVAVARTSGGLAGKSRANIWREAVRVEACNRRNPIKRDAVSPADGDEVSFLGAKPPLLPDFLSVNCADLRQALEAIEANEVPVKEVTEIVPGEPHGVPAMASKFHVVAADRPVHMRKVCDRKE